MKINSLSYIANGKEIIIREVCINDAEQLLSHLKRTYEETIFQSREIYEMNFSIEAEIKFIDYKTTNPTDLCLVAVIDDEVVGLLDATGSKLLRLCHKVNFGVAVQKRYWGFGIGKKLIECMIDWARMKGIEKITLHVDTANDRAISLYKKLGFEIEGTLRKDKRFSDSSYGDVYAMALFL